MKSFKELRVWNESMDLVCSVYSLTKLLPKEELYSLSDQMRRAAVSIPSNIAEGNSRAGAKERLRYLNIAMGSVSELETQLILCARIGYLSPEQIQETVQNCEKIARMLVSFADTIRSSPQY